MATWRRSSDRPVELAICVGVALTVAASPLLWIHNHIIVLVPCSWLLVVRPAASSLARLGAVCIVLTSRMPGVVLGWAGWDTAMPVTTSVS